MIMNIISLDYKSILKQFKSYEDYLEKLVEELKEIAIDNYIYYREHIEKKSNILFIKKNKMNLK